MGETVLIDCDPGQDDAVALLLAFANADRLDVKAITAVAGNAPVERTTANALRVRDLARAATPVFRGAEAPLVLPLETAEFVCGPDGLAGSGLPPPTSAAQAGHAVHAIIDLCRAAPENGVTLCALGPLTNLALAFRLAPDILPRVRRIVMMGGAVGLGNMTPAAEFNVYVDPHAAAVVLSCGRPVVMFGLGVTLQALASAEQIARLGAANAAGRCVQGMLTRPRHGGLGSAGHPMHDPCVVAWLLWPELFEGRACFVEVETGAGPLRGRTTIDWNGRLTRAPNANVIGALDAPAMFERIVASLSRLP